MTVLQWISLGIISVLTVDGALLAKLVPTTETTNVDSTRDGEICPDEPSGFRCSSRYMVEQ